MLRNLMGLMPSVPKERKHSIPEDKEVLFDNGRLIEFKGIRK